MAGFTLLKRTFHEFSDDDCTTMAAALAYYTVFSLPSILLIVILVAGAVIGGKAAQGTTVQGFGGALGGGAAGQISSMVESARRGTSGGNLATIIAFAMLAFSATTVVVQLQAFLNRAWDVKADPAASSWKTVVWKRLYSFSLIVVVGALLVASLALTTLVQQFGRLLPVPNALIMVAEALVTLAIITVLFTAVLKILPDVEIEWREIRFGAFVTAILFTIGKYLVGLYLSHSNVASGYGAAGSLAVLLLWTYYSSITFLLGAEFTQVWARRSGREFRPAKGAIRIVKEPERPDELRPAA